MEIHVLSPDENSIDEEEYKLMGVITEQNKNNLKWFFVTLEIFWDFAYNISINDKGR